MFDNVCRCHLVINKHQIHNSQITLQNSASLHQMHFRKVHVVFSKVFPVRYEMKQRVDLSRICVYRADLQSTLTLLKIFSLWF
jgi:hypothetical protein